MNITQEEYKQKYNEDDAVGWDCISHKLNEIYDSQQERHYATLIKYIFGGEDPLDGVSIYDNNTQEFHRHLISFGMSELYFDPELAGKEFSKWGFEFTFRIKPYSKDEEFNDYAVSEPMWVIGLMNNLARYVFESGKWFEPYHFTPANGPIRLDTDTQIVGVAFIPDTQLDRIDTPHGEVIFLQMVGLTQDELDWLWQEPTTTRCKKLIDIMRKDNPMLITDLNRKFSYVKSQNTMMNKLKNFFSK